LNISKTGSGTGTVSSSPAGIDCGSTCSANFDEGTQVTLHAAPTAGSVFTGWSGDCSGTSDCVVTMSQARSATPSFVLGNTPSWTVNLSTDHDDGACTIADCTLREAINRSNTNPGTDTISFSVPGNEIFVTSDLPLVTAPVVIDGTTQPGFVDC